MMSHTTSAHIMLLDSSLTRNGIRWVGVNKICTYILFLMRQVHEQVNFLPIAFVDTEHVQDTPNELGNNGTEKQLEQARTEQKRLRPQQCSHDKIDLLHQQLVTSVQQQDLRQHTCYSMTLCPYATKVVFENVGFEELINDMRKATRALRLNIVYYLN